MMQAALHGRLGQDPQERQTKSDTTMATCSMVADPTDRIVSLLMVALSPRESIEALEALACGSPSMRQHLARERNRALRDAAALLTDPEASIYARSTALADAVIRFGAVQWPKVLDAPGAGMGGNDVNGLLTRAFVFGCGKVPRSDRGLAPLL